MIRDFCDIRKDRLVDEIKELKRQIQASTAPQGVLADSVSAIDHVRAVGNIGAHMEKDINVIVDVEPKEAILLIELVETLFAEWYVARENRRARLDAIAKLAAEKQADKQSL